MAMLAAVRRQQPAATLRRDHPGGGRVPISGQTDATRPGDNTPRIIRTTGAVSHAEPSDQHTPIIEGTSKVTGGGRRPVAVAVVSGLGLVALASLALGARTGLSQTEQFRDPPEAVVAQERLAEAFPVCFSSPLRVATTPDDVEAVTSATEKVGAVDVRPAGSQGDLTEVDVVLADAAGTSGSLATTRALRSELADVAPDALVGGEVAEDVDSRDASSRNRAVLVPVVLGILLLVLPRPMVATLLLNATKVLS